jgi:acetylornithine deacetylase/succinyl-diaminopimelate desuccinylase-like protein
MSSSTVVELLEELISTPSVNPRLADAKDRAVGAQLMTEWLGRFCGKAGWRWALQEVHPGRSNVVALVPGARPGVQLWEAHQDTVGVQGMHEPFKAVSALGRVSGRGACDDKGGMAAMLAALMRCSAEPETARPTIILASTVNEECGFTGAKALADIWRDQDEASGEAARSSFHAGGGLSFDELRELRPHAAIVAEPTDLQVVVAHRGVVRWRCHTLGRAAHSSRPEQGANAVYAMMSVVQLLEEFHRETLGRRGADPLCGPSTVCVTTIHGGAGANTVPDRTVIDVDRRLTPEESPEDAVAETVAHLADRAELRGCRLEHELPWMQSRGLSNTANREWAEQVASTVRSIGRPCELIGVPYGTNAATIAAAGIPTVVFGPGSIDQAHTVDEWIAVDQLEAAVEALCAVAGTISPRAS